MGIMAVLGWTFVVVIACDVILLLWYAIYNPTVPHVPKMLPSGFETWPQGLQQRYLAAEAGRAAGQAKEAKVRPANISAVAGADRGDDRGAEIVPLERPKP